MLQGGIFNSPIFDAKNNALIYVDMTNGEPSLRAVSIFTKDKINLEKLGSTGYLAGGPSAWLANANQILGNKK